jgi:hypothetical protein
MSNLNDAYYRNHKTLFHTLLIGVLAWGVLCGAGFIFIFAKSRERELRG